MLHGKLLGDTELERLIDDRAYVRAAVTVERALVQGQAAAGVTPRADAAAIDRALESYEPDPAELLAASAKDGVFVPALVKRLRTLVGPALESHVHRGVTSQDVIDTATILILRRALDIVARRMEETGDALAALADVHAETAMLSRTRMQVAAVTTFGYKAAGWLAPCTRHRQRYSELGQRLFVVSLGGASGHQAALGPSAANIETDLAERLGLRPAISPWHGQRDRILEAGAWLAQICASAGKVATDLILLGQNEIGEVRPGGGGGSSTLPGKNNPVRAEAIVALSHHAAAQLTALAQSSLHQHERGGTAWSLEWLTLPSLVVAAGASLRLLREILAELHVDAERMRANIDATGGTALAEAAVFLLAGHVTLPEARRRVEQAGKSRRPDQHLFDVLAASEALPLDWQLEKNPLRHTGRAYELTHAITAQWRGTATMNQHRVMEGETDER